jgi:hypothetical protein
VGITPFEWSAQADDEEIAWEFAHEGYESQTHNFVPDSAQKIEVALVQAAAAKSVHKIRNPRNSRPPRNPKDPKNSKDPKEPKKQVGENMLEPDF